MSFHILLRRSAVYKSKINLPVPAVNINTKEIHLVNLTCTILRAELQRATRKSSIYTLNRGVEAYIASKDDKIVKSVNFSVG